VLGISDGGGVLASLDKYAVSASDGLLMDVIYFALNVIAGVAYSWCA
jgi:hypothetical protein